ncbi:phage tail tape measure protein [Leuconostoc mesenteroides]|uniref:phage tail tape measure protein n=1 Tax=Leuconostoc mesenteroides TaxID=1245 RepID=UPI0021A793F2|nr:phage tail tape measure protein [Leuconostoc mesenteroides]MCT3050363.1 phage tail tape measure protein [Leuconostoc mesenteroides]
MESYSVQAVLSAVDKNLSSTFGKAAQAASDFESKSKQSLENVGKFMAVAGAAVTAIGIKSVNSFGDFQSSLNKAAVIAGGTSKDIQGLADVANHMGAVLPISAQDAADAMVAMARDGASLGTIKKEFPAIAEAATAAGADLQTTASVVQQSMNIWGDSLESPQQAAAILTETANLSNASIEDMQQALATIGGTASNAGISMTDTSEAIGLLTNKGFSAAQASLDLNHALLLMQAPSDKAAKQAAALGLNFNDAQGNMKPLPQILNEIADSMDGMSSSDKAAALKTMFGSSGMAAILPLMKSIKDKTDNTTTSWDAYSKAMQAASGDTATATSFLNNQANEMQKNLGSKIEQVGGNWEALRNAAMAGSAGVISSIVDMMSSTLEWATTSNSAIGSGIRTFLGLSPIIGAATLATGSFLTAATKIGSVMSSVGTALKGLFISPLGLALLAIAALASALSLAYKYSQPFRDAIKSIGDAFTKVFNPATKKSGGEITKFGTAVSSVMKTVGEAFGDKLAKAINSVNWEKVFTKIKNVMDSVVRVATQAVYVFGILATKVANSGKAAKSWDILKSVLKSVYGYTKLLYDKFKDIYDRIGEIGGKSANVGAALQSAFAITSVASILAALSQLPKLLGFILSPAKKVGGAFGSMLSNILPFGSKASQAAGAAEKATKPFSNLALKVLEFGVGVGVAAGGLAALAFGISSLASQGQQGTATLKAFGEVVGILAGEFAILGGRLTAGAVGIGVMLGGLTALALAFTALASTGQQGQKTMVVFALAVSGVAGVFAVLGPMLTASAVGIAAFGVAMLAVGAGIGLATLGMAAFITALNNTTASASQIISTMAAVGAGFAAMVASFLTTIMAQAPLVVNQFILMIINILNVITAQLPSLIASGVQLIVAFLTGINTAIPQIVPVIIVLLTTIVTNIVTYMPILVQNGISLILAFISGVVQAVPQIVPAIVNMLAVIMDTISANLPQIISSGANLLVSFIKGIISIIPTVVPVIIDLIVTIINTIAGKLGDIINAGVNLLIKFIQGVAQTIPRIVSTVVNLIVTFINAVANNLGKIINAGINLLAKFIMGIVNAIPRITGIAVQAVERFVYGVGNALGQIMASGNRLLSIFVQGIMSGYGEANNSGSGAARQVLNGISGISLFHAGASIMSGFLSGLRSMWGGITSFVGSIAGWIKAHKGPISYDKRLLIPAGNAIMNGLNAGLVDNFKTVQKNVSGMAGSILDAATSVGNLATNAIGDPINALNNNIGGSYSGSLTMKDSSLQMQNNSLLRKIANKSSDIYLDGNTLVGGTANRMDNALGNNTRLRGRLS